MFLITQKSGFHISFTNGWTVSVQWREGTYADLNKDRMGAITAEVGTWSDKKPTIQIEGWQTPEQVAAIIAAVAQKSS